MVFDNDYDRHYPMQQLPFIFIVLATASTLMPAIAGIIGVPDVREPNDYQYTPA
jgi:hypothetical protein